MTTLGKKQQYQTTGVPVNALSQRNHLMDVDIPYQTESSGKGTLFYPIPNILRLLGGHNLSKKV